MMNGWYEVVIIENGVEIRALGEIWDVSFRDGSLGCLEQSQGIQIEMLQIVVPFALRKYKMKNVFQHTEFETLVGHFK